MEREKLLSQTMFKTQFGSRLYGTNTDKSDTDWKYIFLPDLRNVLLGKQVLKCKFVSPNMTDKSQQIDEDFIPVQKFAYDFFNGVPYAIEVAFGATGNHACQEFFHPEFKRFVLQLRIMFLTKKLSGFLGYVNNMSARMFKALETGEKFDFKDAYHCLRIAQEATELLANRSLRLPYPESIRDRFVEVKLGSHSVETLKPDVINAVNLMEAAFEHTDLPPITPELEEMFDQFMVNWMSRFYNITL